MKLLIIIALALIVGAGLIWVAEFEPGFVLLKYGNWSLETSLIVFIVAFLLLLLAGYLLLRTLVFAKRTPQKIANWQSSRRHKRAGQALTRGLITLEEGRWAEAERLLARHAGNSETPLLHYLAAARAAQKQNASQRRDDYLRLAHETTEGADVAVGVVQAELQLAADQKEQALATLQHLREVAPKHPYVLQLLQKLYTDMNEWESVQDVLPDLRKRHVLPSSEVKALSVNAATGQMQAALERGDWATMQSLWQQAPAKVKKSEGMLLVYILGLEQHNLTDQAQTLIEEFLHKSWSDQLIYHYGKIVQGDSLPQLAKAEKWLKDRRDNPWLLLTLGRLAAANNLWAKAEEYLLTSIEYGERGETYQVLAKVLAENDKEDHVIEAYQKGLALALMQNDVLI
jgi:HemY protein